MSTQHCIATILFLMTATATAQNQVLNAEFHTDLSDWTLSGNPLPVHDLFDSQDDPTSGSALVTNALAEATTDLEVLTQCVPIDAAGGELGASAFIPSGQDRAGSVVVRLVRYNTPDCTGGSSGVQGHFVVQSDTTDSWESIRVDSIAVPGSAEFIFAIRKTEAGGSFEAFVDAAVLTVDDSVFVSGFED